LEQMANVNYTEEELVNKNISGVYEWKYKYLPTVFGMHSILWTFVFNYIEL
jgi:hypothetical protein